MSMDAPRQQRAIEHSRADARPRAAGRRRKRAPLTAAAKAKPKAKPTGKKAAKTKPVRPNAKTVVKATATKKSAKKTAKTSAKNSPVAKKKTPVAKKNTAKPAAKSKPKNAIPTVNQKPTRAKKPASIPRIQQTRRAAALTTPTALQLMAASPPEGLAFRLDPRVTPLAYRLRIRVDPSVSGDYAGEVEIDIRLEHPRSELELHGADLTVHSASVEWAEETRALEIETRPERETIVLQAPSELPEGTLTLRLGFRSTLRNDLRGFYAAKSGERSYAFTQLEAADARRFFPCFDEPAKKARFRISVTTGSRNRVVSNNPIERVEQRGPDEKTVHFRETPLLSSYLVALAVGELSESLPVYAGQVPIRIIHVPGSEAMTQFALDTARECLTRLAEYFDVPYPYQKLDLVAVPDFEIGAMENAGAVFFRETLLLVDEASVSLAELKRAAEVICHELAHMWYGNLVTMRWWDDLWLNEAFATWMAFDIVAKWRPEWKMWNDFCHSRDSALQLDSLENTHAIYTPVSTPNEATQNFDLITYEKGAAVVRMLERYLGAEVFQRGVRSYIQRHRESNTVARDLWDALSDAAGRDVDAVVKPFVEQPGFPLLRIEQHAGDGEYALQLQQERFDARGPGANPDDGSSWQVPWVGRLGDGAATETERHLLEGARAIVPLAKKPEWVYGNADEGGFFRPLHHPRDLPALRGALPRLAPSERLGFVQHQWALVRAGYAELETFLPLMAALGSERDPDVLRALLGPSDFLVEDLARAAGSDEREQLQAHMARTFGPALAELGWGPSDGRVESNETRLRRAELLTLVSVIAEDEHVVAEAEARCADYLRDRRGLDANLVGPVLVIGARHADVERLDRLLDLSESDATPQARRRFRLVIADVRDPVLIENVLLACLTSRIPTQDVAFVLARLIRNPHAGAQAFDFLRANWSALRERVPSMLVSRLIDATPALANETQRRAVMSFFTENPVPTATRALRQADERFRLDAGFRTRAAPALRRWLAEQAVG